MKIDAKIDVKTYLKFSSKKVRGANEAWGVNVTPHSRESLRWKTPPVHVTGHRARLKTSCHVPAQMLNWQHSRHMSPLRLDGFLHASAFVLS